MKPATPNLEELRVLAEAAIEDRLTTEQRARLEQIVLASPEARRFYAEYVHQHAVLQWSAANPAYLLAGAKPERFPRLASADPSAGRANPSVPSGPRGRWFGRWSIAAAIVGISAWLGMWLLHGREPRPVATLAETKGCKWDGGTLPTEVGALLQPGRLRLAEGLAHISFTSGAELTLEGPADVELVSPMRCVVHAGQLLAKVPPKARGFVVETPSSVLTDLGTEFGVKVHEGQTADVQVFHGQVDVWHRPSGRTEAMKTGAVLRFTPGDIRTFNPNMDLPDDLAASSRRLRAGTRELQISTAQGRGRDAFVQPIEPPPDRRTDILLLIKHARPGAAESDRKAYLGLDLTPVEGRAILDAELSVTFAPTGWGYASLVPDATFVLYGLTDEALDDWEERTLRWQNAPGNQPGGATMDPAKVVRLGSFALPQGQQTGIRSVVGQPLVDFLRSDTNKLATFILVRHTQGIGQSDLVHGIASKRHPSLSPPTLRLTVVDPR
jgi:ferric-dicitrate binding protein FerR (iron transport regulator)